MTEPATDLAPLLWGESISATGSLGRIEVPVTDTDGNTVGVLHLDHANAVDLANQLLDHASGAAQDAIDAMLAASEAQGQRQRDRERLRAARFVAEQWRAWALEDVTKRLFAAHVLACVLAALDGETDPDKLGIDPGAHDAFRAALEGHLTCVWPSCLTEYQQQELSEEIGRQMHGEPPTPVAVDQRDVCGCEQTAIMGSEPSKETRA